MNEMLEKPSLGFEKIIKTHFYLNKDNIISEINGWVAHA